MDKTYSIYRHRCNFPSSLVAEGLSEQEAKAYVKDPETSSATCSEIAIAREKAVSGCLIWFDSFAEE